MSEDVLEAAHACVKAGLLPVIPLHHVSGAPTSTNPKTGKPRGGCSCRDAECESQGKHPLHADWAGRGLVNGADIQATFEDTPHNLGFVTGERFWVLDIDLDKQGALESWERLKSTGLPMTRTHRTGSGGLHLFFERPDFEVTNSPGRLRDEGYVGVDVRGTGGQVALPPSRNLNGTYEVLFDEPIAAAPEWLLDLLRPIAYVAPEHVERDTDLPVNRYVESAIVGCVQKVMDSVENPMSDGRNNELNRQTFSLATMIPHGVITEDEIRQHMTNAGLAAGLGAGEVQKTVNSGIKGGIKKPRDPWPPPSLPTSAPPASLEENTAADESWARRSWDDRGDADRLWQYAGDLLRWVADAERWALYQDGRWTTTKNGGLTAAMDMVDEVHPLEARLYSAEKPAGDEKLSPRQKFEKWAATRRYQNAYRNIAKTYSTLTRAQVVSADFDRHTMLLNCPAGVIDLTNGALLDHNPDLLMRQMISTSPVEGAQAPMWLAFLERCLPDREMRNYFQRIVGYSLTGSTSEQAMFMHYGNTANGKSVMFRVLEALMGDYGQVVPPKTLVTTKNEQHPADLVRMEGKRFLQMSELSNGARLNEEQVKRLTGGETISARGMGQEWREIKVVGKIHVATNHLPHINDDEATRRRIHLIHWPVSIPEEERDGQLGEKIIERELPGVLAWALEGVAEWTKHGLARPMKAEMDAEAYFAGEDLMGMWLSERTAPETQPDVWASTDDLYASYRGWCLDAGLQPATKVGWGRQLGRRPGIEKRRTSTRRGWSLVIVPRTNEGAGLL